MVIPPGELREPQVPVQFMRDVLCFVLSLLKISAAAAEEDMHLLKVADHAFTNDFDTTPERRAGGPVIIHLRRQFRLFRECAGLVRRDGQWFFGEHGLARTKRCRRNDRMRMIGRRHDNRVDILVGFVEHPPEILIQRRMFFCESAVMVGRSLPFVFLVRLRPLGGTSFS